MNFNKKKLKDIAILIFGIIIFGWIFIYCSKLLIIRFCGEKVKVTVEYVYPLGVRDTHTTVKVNYNGQSEIVIYCRNNLLVGNQITAYKCGMFKTMVYSEISTSSVLFHILGAFMSVLFLVGSFYSYFDSKT